MLGGALVLATALPAAAVDLDPIVPVAPDGQFPQSSIDPATGNALVVWQSTVDDSIWGQIVSTDLSVVLPAVQITDSSEEVDWSQPFAAWNSDAGNWLVVWDNDAEVWAATFGSSGVLTGPAIVADSIDGVGSSSFDDIEQTEAAWSTTSDVYLVGFKAESVTSGCQELFGVLVDATGVSLSADAAAPISSASSEGACDLEADNGLGLAWAPSTNQWLVDWYDEFEDLTMGRFIEAGATLPEPASDAFELGPNEGGGAGSVAYDSINNQFLVAWYHDSDSGPELRGAYVLANQTVGGSFPISDTERDVRRPRVALDTSTGMFYVVAHANAEVGSQVWLWELPAGSTTLVANPQLIGDQPDDSERPAIASANGCTIVVWQHSVSDGEEGEFETVQGRSTCIPAALAATGSDSSVLIGAGLLALLLGTAALIAARRQRIAD